MIAEKSTPDLENIAPLVRRQMWFTRRTARVGQVTTQIFKVAKKGYLHDYDRSAPYELKYGPDEYIFVNHTPLFKSLPQKNWPLSTIITSCCAVVASLASSAMKLRRLNESREQ